MSSSGVASFLIVFLVAFCVSNSVTQDTECSRDIECAFKCKHGGFCDLKTGKCSCLPAWVPESNILPVVDTKCKIDADCVKSCPPGCKVYECADGVCFCDLCG